MFPGQHHLKQRAVAGVARYIQSRDDLLERNLLVFESRQSGRFDPFEELVEGRIACQIEPQRQGVHEESDQRFQLGRIAIGDGNTNHQIFLAAVTRQQHRPGAQHDHEQTGAGLACQRPQPLRGFLGNAKAAYAAAIRLHRWPGTIGR